MECSSLPAIENYWLLYIGLCSSYFVGDVAQLLRIFVEPLMLKHSFAPHFNEAPPASYEAFDRKGPVMAKNYCYAPVYSV